jgi:hypothetical protein
MKGPYVRTRNWNAYPISGFRRLSPGSGSYLPYSYPGQPVSETCTTFLHNRLAGGRWSGGGAFGVSRQMTTWDPSPLIVSDNLINGEIRVEGPTVSIPALPLPALPTNAQLDALGTTALARTEPTRPAFDLSVFLGELMREGIPNAPGLAVREQTRLAKSAGSEYLNIEFGWLPLVRGIRDFAKTVDESDRILRSYQEQANTIIQRSYEWPEIRTDRSDSFSLASMYPASALMQADSNYRQSSFVKKWFEVEYRYFLPVGSTPNDKFRRFGSYARKLLGIDLSPEVLWNLAPWSWAADWVSNTGDVLHNVSAIGQDGLVIQHGYVMYHRGRTKEFTAKYVNVPQMRTDLVETKHRQPATPFGWGVDMGNLSPKRLAILAAVGISRLP